MHGLTSFAERTAAPSRSGRMRGWFEEHRRFFLVVIVPTLLLMAYYGLFAANQYESEAHFMVRSSEQVPAPTGLGQALTLVGGVTTAQSEAYSVGDYLTSHDAVAALQKRVNLVEKFRRPEADLLSRLLYSRPTAETLLGFYRKQVDVKFNSDTGIATLRVRSFRPTDSYAIINSLLALGEQRVNSLNERAYRDTLGVARRQLADAESLVAERGGSLTAYRERGADIDPQATGQAQIALVSSLTARLSAARAQEQAMAGAVDASSPQLVAMRARVRALQAEVGAASSKLTAGRSSIAAGLGGYQSLQLRAQFAAKQYDAAAAGLERAREQAMKQQLFIVRVVEPNMPEKALYPKSLKVILTVFFGLLLAYAIGWLIAAGVREHAS